jgi:O-antigen ligase
MANVALHMTAAHPLLGVGIGHFQSESRAWIAPDLIQIFPPAAAGENAHNNFLQVMAEVGIPGALAFVWMLATPLVLGWRSIRINRASPEVVALWLGASAFLFTCLAGHPLLAPQVLMTFFLALGLMRGLAEPDKIH